MGRRVSRWRHAKLRTSSREFDDSASRSTPAIYYLKPHYEGYECVLARVKLLDDDELKELLETGWQFVRSTKGTKPKRRS